MTNDMFGIDARHYAALAGLMHGGTCNPSPLGWAENAAPLALWSSPKGRSSLSPRHRLGAAKSVIHFIGIYLQVPRICYNTNMTLLLTHIQELASRTSLLSVSQLRDEGIARPQISRLVAAGHLKACSARSVCHARLPAL